VQLHSDREGGKTMRNRMVIALAAMSFSLWLVGCSADSGGSGDNANAGVVYRTFVRLNPDGTQTVRHAQVSREQSRAELAGRVERQARRAQAAAKGLGVAVHASPSGYEGPDPCPDQALWIFDVPYAQAHLNQYWSCQGQGPRQSCVDQELCVEGGAGFLDLTTQEYSEFGFQAPVSWYGHIRSYYPGSCGGGFDGDFSDCPVGFDAGTGPVDVSSSCVNTSPSILMYTTGC
jgi:hypothetical protein